MTGYIPRDTVPIHDTAPSEVEVQEVTLKPCGCDPSIDQSCPICYRHALDPEPERFTELDLEVPGCDLKSVHPHSPFMNREHGNILNDALEATQGPRQAAYGHPSVNWGRTAKIASSITGLDLTPAQCVQVAFAMKLARLQQTPGHRDSLVDLAGYAWVWSEVVK